MKPAGTDRSRAEAYMLLQHDAHVKMYRRLRRYAWWLNETRFRPWET